MAGLPPGVAGAAMTGFLAWLTGKCVLETRRLLDTGIIHRLPGLGLFATCADLWPHA